jgi:hypothetical protein
MHLLCDNYASNQSTTQSTTESKASVITFDSLEFALGFPPELHGYPWRAMTDINRLHRLYYSTKDGAYWERFGDALSIQH